jgi:tagatose 1,6-diphosphate aldolase
MEELRPLAPLVDRDLELHLVEITPGDPAKNIVPAYKFEMRVAGARVGDCDLRVGTTERLERYGGHIGYGVEEPHRGNRYAARACRLLLPVAREQGMQVLWITCNPENIASRRTCELAGGEFVDIVSLPPDIDMYARGERYKCRYRFVL